MFQNNEDNLNLHAKQHKIGAWRWAWKLPFEVEQETLFLSTWSEEYGCHFYERVFHSGLTVSQMNRVPQRNICTRYFLLNSWLKQWSECIKSEINSVWNVAISPGSCEKCFVYNCKSTLRFHLQSPDAGSKKLVLWLSYNQEPLNSEKDYSIFSEMYVILEFLGQIMVV